MLGRCRALGCNCITPVIDRDVDVNICMLCNHPKLLHKSAQPQQCDNVQAYGPAQEKLIIYELISLWNVAISLIIYTNESCMDNYQHIINHIETINNALILGEHAVHVACISLVVMFTYCTGKRSGYQCCQWKAENLLKTAMWKVLLKMFNHRRECYGRNFVKVVSDKIHCKCWCRITTERFEKSKMKEGTQKRNKTFDVPLLIV